MSNYLGNGDWQVEWRRIADAAFARDERIEQVNRHGLGQVGVMAQPRLADVFYHCECQATLPGHGLPVAKLPDEFFRHTIRLLPCLPPKTFISRLRSKNTGAEFLED